MQILLDTHILLWAMTDTARLAPSLQEALEADDAVVYVSLVSLWELRIKEAIGKLRLPKHFYTALEPAGLTLLSLKPSHIHEYGVLPMHHRDPFDRMLVAQARCERLALASDDREFRKYDVHRVGV